MAKKDSETIFLEEAAEGIERKDKYRVIVASSLFLLQERVNELSKDGDWDIVGGAIETSLGFCQTMVRMPKTRVARQSLA